MGFNTLHHHSTSSRGTDSTGEQSLTSEDLLLDVLNQPKRYVRINTRGDVKEVEVSKHTLVAHLRIPYRDIRTLDPLVPGQYESYLVSRGETICCAVDNVRCIITSRYALFITLPPPARPSDAPLPATPDAPLIKALSKRLAAAAQHSPSGLARSLTAAAAAGSRGGSGPAPQPGTTGGGGGGVAGDDEGQPFEFVVLEAALAGAVAGMEAALQEVERGAGPIIEAMTEKVHRKSLERVRALKQEIALLDVRVQRFIEELNDLMNKDDDMAEFYLTRNEQRCGVQAAGAVPAPLPQDAPQPPPDAAPSDIVSPAEGADGEELPRADVARNIADRSAQARCLGVRDGRRQLESDDEAAEEEGDEDGWAPWRATSAALKAAGFKVLRLRRIGEADGGSGSGSIGISSASLRRRARRRKAQYRICSVAVAGGPAEACNLGDGDAGGDGGRVIATVQEKGRDGAVRMMEVVGVRDYSDVSILEDLLEHYFTLAEFLRNRLRNLDEQIGDSEALVNIELDNKRNELVALNLVATVLALGLGVVAAVAGLFGMNLKNEMEESHTAFIVVSTLSALGTILIVLLLLGLAQYRKLLWLPDPQVLKVPAADKSGL